jgi:CRP-like cAMP-binding protein
LATKLLPEIDARPRNRILRALPPDAYQRLLPDLETIPIWAKFVFHRAGEPMEYVYFPNGGVASLTTVMKDGTMVEAATIGHEGVIGLDAFFTDRPVATGQSMVQVPDTSAERLTVVAFRRELALHGVLAELMGEYAETTIKQLMHAAACNALHKIQERCCRWLLMVHDRVDGDAFDLSHEFLGVMLGVRRQSVTEVAGTLQDAGLLTYRHGHVRVLDRQGLEAGACECYALMRRNFEALFR